MKRTAGDVKKIPFLLLGPVAALIVGCLPFLGPRAVDNSRCHVCHVNFERDDVAVGHAKNGIGCESCHGRSDAHCGDENNATAPDKMYPRATINLTCLKCHTSLPRTSDHKPVLAAPATAPKVCTDCHGDHRVAFRNRHWDRTTGKLLDSK